MIEKNDDWVQDTINLALNESDNESGGNLQTTDNLNESVADNVIVSDVLNESVADNVIVSDVLNESVADNVIQSDVSSELIVDSEVPSDSSNESEADNANQVEAVTSDSEIQQASPETEVKKKKSVKGKVIFVLTALLAMVVAGMWVGYTNFAVIGDIFGSYEIYSRSVSEVDLSGSDIDDFSGLSRLDKAETIDLSNTSIEDLSPLYKCDSLKTVILGGKVMPAEQCVAFYDAHPDTILICDIEIDAKIYDSRVEKLKISSMSESSMKLLASLHELKLLDLTLCSVSDDTYDYLHAKLPNCEIARIVSFDGSKYLSNIETLVLTENVSESEIDKLKYFPSLGMVDARECSNTELLDKIGKAYPQLTINRSVTILGVEAGSVDELLDLRGNKYKLNEVKAALDENLKKFSNLKKIDMCGCGLTNEEMEELTKTYPDIKFVWIIKFGRWKVRTDAVVFSSLNGNGSEIYNEKHYAKLFKYCTDLMALDLGHSLIVDISAISNLKNLRAVILTDNKISDISSFAELKDLEFIEMNVNRVKSVEPLKDLSNLKYINLWSSRAATDLSSLYNHESLELVIFHRTVSQEERQRFIESNPNCRTFFTVDTHKNLSTNKAWRANPYRVSLKKAFASWKKVVGWSEETGFIYDENTDQYKIM